MTIKIGINGFGRMGRLALRAAWNWPELEFVHINEPGGDIATAYTQHTALEASPWLNFDVNLLLECSGKFKSKHALAPLLTPPVASPEKSKGIKKIVVSAPVKDGTLNIVMGVNDHLYRAQGHHIVTWLIVNSHHDRIGHCHCRNFPRIKGSPERHRSTCTPGKCLADRLRI